MKGGLHTDELMAAVVSREGGLRGVRAVLAPHRTGVRLASESVVCGAPWFGAAAQCQAHQAQGGDS